MYQQPYCYIRQNDLVRRIRYVTFYVLNMRTCTVRILRSFLHVQYAYVNSDKYIAVFSISRGVGGVHHFTVHFYVGLRSYVYSAWISHVCCMFIIKIIEYRTSILNPVFLKACFTKAGERACQLWYQNTQYSIRGMVPCLYIIYSAYSTTGSTEHITYCVRSTRRSVYRGFQYIAVPVICTRYRDILKTHCTRLEYYCYEK